MRRPFRGLALVLLVAALPAAGRAATVTVAIDDIRSDKGHLRIGVCQRSEFLSEYCRYHAVVPSRTGTVTATIPDVPPGTYAVAAFQDEDDTGHMRRNFLGVPKDGLGFSRNPKLGFGPPSWAQCALGIGKADVAIAVTLHYY